MPEQIRDRIRASAEPLTVAEGAGGTELAGAGCNAANAAPIWPGLDRRCVSDIADYLAVALAVSLPWSTSATGVLVVVWLLVVLPTLDVTILRREIMTWAGGLPLLLVALAALGMAWADVAWSARAAGLASFLKLSVIPLLFIQFRRSERGLWIVYGLLAASVLLLLASFAKILLLASNASVPERWGVVVKDYISQSGFFTLCIFLLMEFAAQAWREQRHILSVACAVLAAAFLGNIVYVSTSRTTLLTIPFLLILFGLRRNWKIALGACVVGVVLAAAAWASSPYLRQRIESTFSLSITTGQRVELSSTRWRLAFWAASLDLVKNAPLIGHGTGSIRAMFQRYAAAHPNSDIGQAANPHNQTFAVAIQLGLLGTLALYAMWLAHGLMFRGPGMAAWFGMVVVVQNFIDSLVNSHLFDFTQGWTYAVCVGVAGGMVLREAPPGSSGSALDAADRSRR